jgi:hypothetical protein
LSSENLRKLALQQQTSGDAWLASLEPHEVTLATSNSHHHHHHHHHRRRHNNDAAGNSERRANNNNDNPLTTTSTSSSSSSSSSEESERTTATRENLECALCFRLFYQPTTNHCGHTYCLPCVVELLRHSVRFVCYCDGIFVCLKKIINFAFINKG